MEPVSNNARKNRRPFVHFEFLNRLAADDVNNLRSFFMAMTTCPYCNTEVSESLIEAEDGCCPECGSMISAPSSLMGDEFDDFDDYDDDSQDIFSEFDDDDGDNDDYVRGDFDEDLFDDSIGDEFDEDFDDDLEDCEDDL